MIFVCTGSRNYQFDRLIKKIDELVRNKDITEEVFAQIGESTYLPTSYKYARYLNADDFVQYQEKARLIITHGGTGAIVGALKKEKFVIGVPRLEKYGEHIDDHQIQIVKIFEEEEYIKAVYNIEDLLPAIRFFQGSVCLKRYSRESNIIKIIDEYIEEI